MLTAAEITAGSSRLAANKLSASDAETLNSVLRLYLKDKAAADFPDLSDKIAAAADVSPNVKTASKLAAILIGIEQAGFGVAALSGGRAGLNYKESDEQGLRIRFALTLLGYDLPETFSGTTESSGDLSRIIGARSGTVPVQTDW